MRMRVTDEGLLIPPALLAGWEEVEVRRDTDMIVITPVAVAKSGDADGTYPLLADDDPLYELGRYPVEDEATNAAVKLDKYLY